MIGKKHLKSFTYSTNCSYAYLEVIIIEIIMTNLNVFIFLWSKFGLRYLLKIPDIVIKILQELIEVNETLELWNQKNSKIWDRCKNIAKKQNLNWPAKLSQSCDFRNELSHETNGKKMKWWRKLRLSTKHLSICIFYSLIKN